MNSLTLTVDGILMRWEEAGSGPAVVFLHGIPTCPRLWREVIPRVPNARCLAWEMVGYGDSVPAGRGRDISLSRQAEYLARWLDALDIESALLVGHDLGGGVAQIAAIRTPHRVRGLVLMNAVCYDSWPILSVKLMRALAPLVERLPAPAVGAGLFGGLFLRGHDNLACARASFAEHWPHYRWHGGAAALVRQIRSLRTRDTEEIAGRLPHLDLPARLIWGVADQFQKAGYGYRLAYDLRAPLDRIEGGKHFVPEDHAGRVATAVTDLLIEVESR